MLISASSESGIETSYKWHPKDNKRWKIKLSKTKTKSFIFLKVIPSPASILQHGWDELRELPSRKCKWWPSCYRSEWQDEVPGAKSAQPLLAHLSWCSTEKRKTWKWNVKKADDVLRDRRGYGCTSQHIEGSHPFIKYSLNTPLIMSTMYGQVSANRCRQ